MVDVAQVKKKIENLKSEVRTYVTNLRRHKTGGGGGPKPADPPPYVFKMMSILGEGSPSQHGIGSGVESGSSDAKRVIMENISHQHASSGSTSPTPTLETAEGSHG